MSDFSEFKSRCFSISVVSVLLQPAQLQVPSVARVRFPFERTDRKGIGLFCLRFIFHLLRSLFDEGERAKKAYHGDRRSSSLPRLKSATTVPINRPPPSPTPKWLHTREFAMTAATNRGLRIPLCHISRHLQASLSSRTACHSQNREPLIPRGAAEIDSFHVVCLSFEHEPDVRAAERSFSFNSGYPLNRIVTLIFAIFGVPSLRRTAIEIRSRASKSQGDRTDFRTEEEGVEWWTVMSY